MSGFTTRAIRAATRAPEVGQRPSVVPIYEAATFASADAAELGEILTGARPGFAYSRIANPTTAALAAAFAELEGAEAGLALATGMAAIHAALVSLVRAGQTIVATRAVYGTTHDLLTNVLGRLGVAVEFVDLADLAAVEEALQRTASPVLYAETIANPTIAVADIVALAGAAHRRGALLVVDNTFASPYLCRPLELGADLVVESGTKYLSGHGDAMAGLVAGSNERVAAISTVLVDAGGALGAFGAFLVLRGLATLGLRMERHSASALALAAWLEGQPGIDRVHYPGLTSHPGHDVAARQLGLFGGMLAFELTGGRRAGAAFIDALELPERTASLGSVRTIVTHPPSTTHRQLDEPALRQAGIAEGLLRCSVGLEDVEDLRSDFARALEAAIAAAPAAARRRASAVPAEPPTPAAVTEA